MMRTIATCRFCGKDFDETYSYDSNGRETPLLWCDTCGYSVEPDDHNPMDDYEYYSNSINIHE